jgi:transcriptional regulator with XRE-family HTH domain
MTQQAFATRMGTAITTIARYETDRTPRGKILAQFAELADQTDQPELAVIFRSELRRQVGVAVSELIRYGPRRLIGPAELDGLIAGVRTRSASFHEPGASRDDTIKAGIELEQYVVGELERWKTRTAAGATGQG